MDTKQIRTISDSQNTAAVVVDTLRRVLEEEGVPCTLHQPLLGGNELKYVQDCVETGWVSSVGSYVDRFEAMLADFTGAKRAVAVVNGTAALQVAMKMVGVVAGDEVLIPALTFVATANAVAYCGAIPHLVDSSPVTLGMDPFKLDDYLREIAESGPLGTRNRLTGNRIRAVVPMHTFGHPVDMDPLIELCLRWKIEIVEDAAESLGSYYKGKHTGTFGRIGTLSFNGNKIVTTGGGGALLFDDEEAAKLAKHLTTTARQPHRWEYYHDALGYNFRLPNLNAALGCAQLENLPKFLERKRKLALHYKAAFSQIPDVAFVDEPPSCHSNWWLNALLLPGHAERDSILQATNDAGIMSRPAWKLMHRLPMYESCPRMELPVASRLEDRIVNIPSSVARK